MVWKKNVSDEQSGPVVDDSWWESLLDDANRYPVSEGGFTAKPRERSAIEPEIDWELMEKYFREDEILTVLVVGYNKGGLLVKATDLKGFVPNSHLIDISRIQSASKRYQELKKCVGKEITVKIIESDPKLGKLILSERAAEKAPGSRLDIFEELSIGSVVEGEVTNITKFGIFVDLGGIEGLIHVSEISWGKVHHPAELVNVGDTIKARVISIDCEKMRIALSIKQLLPNPWYDFSERYLVGDVITVTVTKMVGYGIFAEVENGIEGLIHISDIQSKDDTLSVDDLQIGEKIVVAIKAMDVENRRLSMGFISRF